MSLAAFASDMLAHIDAKAGYVRAQYITIAPGQEATYMLKAQQARDYIAAAYAGAVPPLIAAEMGATGADAPTACAAIVGQESAWGELAAAVELARLSGKRAVRAAATEADAAAALAVAIEQLNGLLP